MTTITIDQLEKLTGYSKAWLSAASKKGIITAESDGRYALATTVKKLFDAARHRRKEAAGVTWADLSMSADELASLTGLTDRRHRHLAKEGYFPQPIRGRYQLIQTIAGLLRWHREQLRKRTGTVAEERERKLRAERMLIELHLRRESGELLEAAEVRRAWEFITMHYKQRTLGLPAKVAPRLPFCKSANDMQKVLETEIREILTDISRPVRYKIHAATPLDHEISAEQD